MFFVKSLSRARVGTIVYAICGRYRVRVRACLREPTTGRKSGIGPDLDPIPDPLAPDVLEALPNVVHLL